MKNKILKIAFTVLVLLQSVWLNQAVAQPGIVPPCPCNTFKAQAVAITAPNGQCCYAIQIQQVYPAASNCKPRTIKLSTTGILASPPVANTPNWVLNSSTGSAYYFTMPAQPVILSSSTWNTVATICTPLCQSIPDIVAEWMVDIGSPTLCSAKIIFAPCPAASCNLQITNQQIVCIQPAGNYTVTYTLTNNGCGPCNSSIGLNQAYNTLMQGSSLPASTLIPSGGSVTQTVSVTAAPGSSTFMMNVCCNSPASVNRCCIKDSIPFPPCDSCRKGCLTPLVSSFCDRGATTIRALYCDDGTPINTTNITWYRAPYPCTVIPTDPNGMPVAPWVLFQASGNTATTSSPILTSSTCYIAFVRESATCQYWTSPTTVFIYPTPLITTIADRDICDPNPSTTGAAPAQTFTIPVGAGQSVQWLQSSNCNTYSQVPASSVTSTSTSSTFTIPAGLNGNCPFTSYCYRVILTSTNCGSDTKDFKVNVYHIPEVGTLTASPLSVCNGKATTIIRQPGCGKIVMWERSAYSNSSAYGSFTGWTDITPHYGTADNFSTNNLFNTTNCVRYIAYRVYVKNGPGCSMVDQRYVIVQVLPDLKPTISTTPSGVVCINPGSVTMTCNLSSCPPPLYPVPPVTYTWYRDIPTSGVGNGQTYTTMQPGTYWVTASNICGTWRSLPVTFCQKPTLKVPDGCICRRPPANGTYNLTVQIIGGCSNCTYNIQWRNKKNAGWLFNGTATGLTSGSNTITIPANKIPPMSYGDLLHFEVTVTGTSCGLSCIPNLNPVTNTIKVCQ